MVDSEVILEIAEGEGCESQLVMAVDCYLIVVHDVVNHSKTLDLDVEELPEEVRHLDADST